MMGEFFLGFALGGLTMLAAIVLYAIYEEKIKAAKYDPLN